MTLRAGRPFSAELEVLDMYSRLDGSMVGIHDRTRRADIHKLIEVALERSLDNPGRLHGWRVQGLFEAVVLCLGKVLLIKQEDSGTFYFDDLNGPIKLPDFRIVTPDGELLLVEVKGVSPKRPVAKQRIRRTDLDAIRRYAEVTGGRLMIAHYWSAWNNWSLVDARLMTGQGKYCELSIEDAAVSNEMVILGDSVIGTVPPLEIRLSGRPVESNNACRASEEIELHVSDIEVCAGGILLADPIEKRVAQFLAIYGEWERSVKVSASQDGQYRTTFRFVPPAGDDEANESIHRQGFAMVGSLSSMYSSLYNIETLDLAGDVRALRYEPEPGLLAQLIPADYWGREDRLLHLWQFYLRPDSSD